MKLPDYCPVCKATFNQECEYVIHAFLIKRTELDWDADEPHRIEDSIMECSHCHSLFRLRWVLESFKQLIEVDKSE
jgi:hypothetical protein